MVKFRVLSLPQVLSLILIGASCATAPEPGSRSKPRDQGPGIETPDLGAALNDKEKADFDEIQGLFRSDTQSQPSELLNQRLTAFEKKYPRSSLIPQESNIHGLVLLRQKRPLVAEKYFKKALQKSSSPVFNQYVLYNQAAAELDAELYDDAMSTLSDIHPENMDLENQIKIRNLKARLFIKKQLYIEAARESLAASKLANIAQNPGERETRGLFSSLLGQALQQIPNPAPIEDLYREFEDAPAADQLLFRIAALDLAAGDRTKAETELHELMTRFPSSSYYSQSADLLRTTRPPGADIVDPTVVGVLLPMRGKFASFGQKALQGIELALRIFNEQEPDSKLTLAIEDSGEDTDSAVQGLEELVTRDHPIAVIGPLLSKGVDQVAQKAQLLGVPLLSLARHAGTPGDFIFPSGLTLKMQAREVARYAVEKLGFKRFAIIYPHEKVGEEASQEFWDAVESLGGHIVGYESYSPGETDFRQPVDKISGLFYTEARRDELDALAKTREENHIKKRTRKTEQYFSLKPIVDYDAVFIPEEAKLAGQILPTFAYRDVDKARFLGLSAWNSPDLAARAQASAEGAVFVDAFFPASQAPAARKFFQSYRETFGDDPTDMEALAYDAAQILEAALSQCSSSPTRSELKDQLRSIKGFPGVTGKISFQDGQFLRELQVLTIQHGQIVEAEH